MAQIVEDLEARRRRRNPVATEASDTGQAAYKGICEMVGSCADPVAAALVVIHGFAGFVAVWAGMTPEQLMPGLQKHMAEAVKAHRDDAGEPDGAA